ncbi:MAG: hypothetical protein IPI31_11065 [Bacteroidetes bacterium]|nr:hypothetical protein [Bacteroidota bacterium]MBK7568350.1 hypothetical protein [Bacteroidota bacterium]
MPDFVGTILMLLFWIFIVNGIAKFFKKAVGNANKDKTTPQAKPQQKNTTFQDIFKELQKKAEEARAKQNMPPYAKPEVKEVSYEKTNRPPQQEVYTTKEAIPEKAKRSDIEFDKFVEEQRKKEHDAEQRNLYKKAYRITTDDEQDVIPFEIDLKNAIIGAMILERPYS